MIVAAGGRAASGGAIAPQPPPATRNQPESIRFFEKQIFLKKTWHRLTEVGAVALLASNLATSQEH